MQLIDSLYVISGFDFSKLSRDQISNLNHG